MKANELTHETEQRQEGSKFARRSFFQKMAKGALISFAGWMAARGANLLWAKELAVNVGEEKPISKKPVLVAQNSHTDTHDDSHNDIHMDDTSYHSDMEGPKGHIDLGGIHTDGHVDLPHTDNHSDYVGNVTV